MDASDAIPPPSSPPLPIPEAHPVVIPRTNSPSMPRSISDPAQTLATPNPIAHVQSARAPGRPLATSSNLPASIAERMKNFHQKRMGQAPPVAVPVIPSMNSDRIMGRPGHPTWASDSAVPPRAGGMSMGMRRANAPGGLPPMGGTPGRKKPGFKLSDVTGETPEAQGSKFDEFSRYVDKETGSLQFAGKARLHGKGVEFSSGAKFSLSLDELQKLEELGKGNYGTVYKVIRRGTAPPRPGGDALTREATTSQIEGSSTSSSGDPTPEDQVERAPLSRSQTDPNPGTIMAMKEIRLELDENKFAQIIMELDVLHKCRSPFIIDFYGAFFQEGAVYICMENMDGGSIDKIYQGGVPEGVLRKIAYSTVMGLKTLKDEHNIIHRDVKPTNILVNTKGEIKLCDFGVSGNLVASIAKTNIGCQSYMAPERIATGGQTFGAAPGTYGVQSDIWSLGLSLLECAMGCYPYPPETYNNIFSQLSAIVDGEPPDLPAETFSENARDFVRQCLHKVPNQRPSYAKLLEHPWISDLCKPNAITEECEEAAEQGADFEVHSLGVARGDAEVRLWALEALKNREARLARGLSMPEKPALHAAPLDKLSPGGSMTSQAEKALGEMSLN